MNSIFLKACRGEATERTPVWFMRQAGRYMAEYRAIRAQKTMLQVINSPELSAEVTLQPINTFGFDAAIIFSDILPPLQGMGLDLEFVKGKGPVIYNPLRENKQIDLLATPPAEESMQGTLDAIGLVSAELTPRNIPLIGFCGAPFTLAAYAVEGSGSKNYAHVKSLMYSEPAAWDRLMNKLVTVMTDYLLKQAQAGASALQIFDSWAGAALGKLEYAEYVDPYNRALIAAVKRRTDVPIIYFGLGTTLYMDVVRENGADVYGVDWKLPLSEAWESLGDNKAIQGNLDPIALLAPWRELKHRIDIVLDQADGRNGHIFNLGHGILPQTPIENVQRTVDYIRERTSN